jgi:hypothetical protein
MKNFNLKILIALCVVSVYFLGCFPCDCCNKKVSCGEHGTCLNEMCSCEDGYEGEKCDILSNTKFVGHWKGQETRQQNGVTDTIKIDWTAQASTLPTDLKITNTNGTINTLKLKGDKLTVQNEIILDNKHIITGGTATINTAKTQINYQFQYKAVDTIPAFYNIGTLVKQ